jgi:hypothetical protein
LPPGVTLDEARRQSIEDGGAEILGRFFDAALTR